MKSRKRAVRRYQRTLKRQRMLHILGPSYGNVQQTVEYCKWIVHNIDHIKACSCWMCGNQRRWHGRTVAEQRWLEYASWEVGEMGLEHCYKP